jgi:hypothetical protein
MKEELLLGDLSFFPVGEEGDLRLSVCNLHLIRR